MKTNIISRIVFNRSRSIGQISAGDKGVPLSNTLVRVDPSIQKCKIWPQETGDINLGWYKAYIDISKQAFRREIRVWQTDGRKDTHSYGKCRIQLRYAAK